MYNIFYNTYNTMYNTQYSIQLTVHVNITLRYFVTLLPHVSAIIGHVSGVIYRGMHL